MVTIKLPLSNIKLPNTATIVRIDEIAHFHASLQQHYTQCREQLKNAVGSDCLTFDLA